MDNLKYQALSKTEGELVTGYYSQRFDAHYISFINDVNNWEDVRIDPSTLVKYFSEDDTKDFYINTFTGKEFHFNNMQAKDICFEDIAGSLSKLCRFTGHCRTFYSVAEHSILVADILQAYYGDKRFELEALLHDAPEAYINDLAYPPKQLCFDYKSLEAKIWSVISQKYDLSPVISTHIKQADLIALATEKQHLMLQTRPWKILEGIKPADMVICPTSNELIRGIYLSRLNMALSERNKNALT